MQTKWFKLIDFWVNSKGKTGLSIPFIIGAINHPHKISDTCVEDFFKEIISAEIPWPITLKYCDDFEMYILGLSEEFDVEYLKFKNKKGNLNLIITTEYLKNNIDLDEITSVLKSLYIQNIKDGLYSKNKVAGWKPFDETDKKMINDAFVTISKETLIYNCVREVSDTCQLGDYQDVLHLLIRKIFRKTKIINLRKDESTSWVRWPNNNSLDRLSVEIGYLDRVGSLDVLWSIFHEAAHLEQGEPNEVELKRGIEQYNREKSAWEIAFKELCKYQKLIDKKNEFRTYANKQLKSYEYHFESK